MEKKRETVRLNIQMSAEMVDYFTDLSEELGIPRSGVMVMALKTYIDQQKTLKMTEQFEYWSEVLEENKADTKS